MKTGIVLCRSAVLLAIALVLSCARAPEVQPEPAAMPSLPPVPPGFVMKSFQVSMHEEMRKSYGQADEIMTGVFAGTYEDEHKGLVYYFGDFSLFDKQTVSWGPAMDVIVEVRPDTFKPEIIRRQEFIKLIALDRVGICWDFYDGRRSVFLVEGQKNLVFLKVGLAEATNDSLRNLLDAYPVTRECRAVDVFNLMIRRLAEEAKGRSMST
ncbi:MAG: hypothetical protein FJY81_07540 [Candidatus Aminicenantes bacterium]|nr:hypothetical protein [Candidatus Aminicenantes bacterium]